MTAEANKEAGGAPAPPAERSLERLVAAVAALFNPPSAAALASLFAVLPEEMGVRAISFSCPSPSGGWNWVAARSEAPGEHPAVRHVRWKALDEVSRGTRTPAARTAPGSRPECDSGEALDAESARFGSLQLAVSRGDGPTEGYLGFWLARAIVAGDEWAFGALTLAICQARDRRGADTAALDHQLTRMRLLHEASRLLADALDPAEIGRTTLAILRKRLPVAAFSVTLEQSVAVSGRTVFTTGDPSDARAVVARNRVLARMARGEGVGQEETHDIAYGWLLGDGWRESYTAAYLPLHAVGRVVGMMSVHFDREPGALAAEREFLESLANMTASALEKARGYQELNEARAVWENTLDCISDLVLLTDARGRLRWINQSASIHLFRGGPGWFEQPISQIPLLRPLASLYEPARLGDQSVTEVASDLPGPDGSGRRFRVRSRIMHSLGTGAQKIVHVLRPENFELPEQPLAQDARPLFDPLPREASPPVSGDSVPVNMVARCWNILLIDDEILLANALSRALRVLGHRVHSYQFGRHVLEEAEDVLRKADLAIVDLRLPDMEGTDLIQRLGGINDHLRYVLTSGIAVADDVLDDLDVPSVFLHKPFRLDDLNAAVGRLMK